MNYVTRYFFACSITLIISFINVRSQDSDDKDDFSGRFWDVEFNTSSEISQPSFEILYGMANPSIHKNEFSGSFNDIQALEIRFGFNSIKEKIFGKNVFEYAFNYFYLGNLSSKYRSSSKDPSNVDIDAWNFGVGSVDGYGYKLGENNTLVLYNARAIAWMKTIFENIPDMNSDAFKLNYIGDSFRFGDYFEGGVKFMVFDPLSITAGYQRILVMPRHLFGKWLVSGAVEEIGSLIIEWFSEEAVEMNPTLGPIVFFVLKNAYSYMFYELRSRDMNWPYNTDAPLMYDDKINIGLSISF